MNDEKWRGLAVQIKILTQETPDGDRGVGFPLLRCVLGVAEYLYVADDILFDSEEPFERSARIHSGVMIDCTHSFPKVEGHLCVRVRSEMIKGNSHGTRKSRQTIVVFLSVCRKTKRTIRQAISKTKAFTQGVAEVLDAHSHFAFRS